MPKPHICTVGTGIAGLRCAQVLVEKDVRVTTMDRPGGRVGHTLSLPLPLPLPLSRIHNTTLVPVTD
jgi:predicted NAD/FAD-binding protein